MTALRRKTGEEVGTQPVESFTISDLAREFGVTLRTLRFYEDRGLLSPHRQGTARIYSGRDRARLSTILKGKNLGFTLTEIRAMLARDERGGGSAELKLTTEQIDEQIGYLENQKREVETALTELKAQRRAIEGGA